MATSPKLGLYNNYIYRMSSRMRGPAPGLRDTLHAIADEIPTGDLTVMDASDQNAIRDVARHGVIPLLEEYAALYKEYSYKPGPTVDLS